MSTYLAEARYPLELAPAMPDVWELWQRAKTLEWDPRDGHPVGRSCIRSAIREEQIMAARLHWSRRTWGEYGAISESPALLLRFCLENRLPDLRFFFTMRTQEEGRHAEASWLMAERLGGYFPQPQNPPTVSAVGHPRRAPDGLRPGHLARGHLREPGLRRRGDPDRRLQGHRAQGHQPRGAAAHGADPARRGAPHRLRLAVSRRVGADASRRRR